MLSSKLLKADSAELFKCNHENIWYKSKGQILWNMLDATDTSTFHHFAQLKSSFNSMSIMCTEDICALYFPEYRSRCSISLQNVDKSAKNVYMINIWDLFLFTILQVNTRTSNIYWLDFIKRRAFIGNKQCTHTGNPLKKKIKYENTIELFILALVGLRSSSNYFCSIGLVERTALYISWSCHRWHCGSVYF